MKESIVEKFIKVKVSVIAHAVEARDMQLRVRKSPRRKVKLISQVHVRPAMLSEVDHHVYFSGNRLL